MLALVLLAAAPARVWAQPHGTGDAPLLVEASLAAILGATEAIVPEPPPRTPALDLPREWRRISQDPPRADRPLVLPALYVSFGALQALDAHSTLRALDRGQAEGNPLMRGIVSQPAAVVGIKAATTAGTIYLTEKLWRRHRTAAIVLMVAVNAGYLAIVTHNYRRAGASVTVR
jgi:hypothetical protein